MEGLLGICVSAYSTSAMRKHRIREAGGLWLINPRVVLLDYGIRRQDRENWMSENDQGTSLESFSPFFPFLSTVFTRKGSFTVIFQSQYYFRTVKKKRYVLFFSVQKMLRRTNCFALGPSLAWKMKLWLSTRRQREADSKERERGHTQALRFVAIYVGQVI